VVHGVNGLLYPALDHQALAQVMITFANRPDLRESMGLAGRKIVEERFSIQQYLAKLYHSYGIDLAQRALAAGVGA
jgi:glycosyltransferase involved in cell wall biosynthesis